MSETQRDPSCSRDWGEWKPNSVTAIHRLKTVSSSFLQIHNLCASLFGGNLRHWLFNHQHRSKFKIVRHTYKSKIIIIIPFSANFSRLCFTVANPCVHRCNQTLLVNKNAWRHLSHFRQNEEVMMTHMYVIALLLAVIVVQGSHRVPDLQMDQPGEWRDGLTIHDR